MTLSSYRTRRPVPGSNSASLERCGEVQSHMLVARHGRKGSSQTRSTSCRRQRHPDHVNISLDRRG